MFLHIHLFSRLYADSCAQFRSHARTPSDGEFNPDYRLVNVNNSGTSMSWLIPSVQLLAWIINGSSQSAMNVAGFVNAWFLANDTYMNPNLDYAQVCGSCRPLPKAHTNALDLKGMVKVVNTVLVLCGVNAPEWTGKIDPGIVAWTKSHIDGSQPLHPST